VLCGHEDQYQQQNELQRAALAVVVQEHCQVGRLEQRCSSRLMSEQTHTPTVSGSGSQEHGVIFSAGVDKKTSWRGPGNVLMHRQWTVEQNAQVMDAVTGMDDGLTKVDSDINQLSVLPAYIDSMN